MINGIKRILRKAQVKINYVRSKIDIVIRNRYPHIKINEKYQKKAKWIIRIITFIGISSTVVSFSKWYYSILFSIILFIVEQLFEQIIFSQNILLVQPMPKLWDGSKWTLMLYGTNKKSFFLGFGFTDKIIGREFFDTLLAWNNNELVNRYNIQLTLVQEDKSNYSVYAYPTIYRDFITSNIKQFEKDFDKKENAGKELSVYVQQLLFCKVFPYTPTCAYNYLIKNHSNIFIQIYDSSMVVNNNPKTHQNVVPIDNRIIIFNDITVCKRKDLSKEKNILEYYYIPKYK